MRKRKRRRRSPTGLQEFTGGGGDGGAERSLTCYTQRTAPTRQVMARSDRGRKRLLAGFPDPVPRTSSCRLLRPLDPSRRQEGGSFQAEETASEASERDTNLRPAWPESRACETRLLSRKGCPPARVAVEVIEEMSPLSRNPDHSSPLSPSATSAWTQPMPSGTRHGPWRGSSEHPLYTGFFKNMFLSRERDRNINDENYGSAASRSPPTGDGAHNPGMCPDQEPNCVHLVH
ncbi:uncharacterized protein LOC132229931 [Myotis daubentonii]|uniref:uncharacterized protein LOC132229931 n=1 Tax=Myotis daubentonii TaxID=98922 RepID=UPI002872B068|nr:uncharacterized protein LOC132229931 [Myotis daubentonii]